MSFIFLALWRFLGWLWPWVKESIFANAPFQEWVRQNVFLCIWIVLWFITAGILADLMLVWVHSSRDLVDYKRQNTILAQSLSKTKQDLVFEQYMVESLDNELQWTRETLVKEMRPDLEPLSTNIAISKTEPTKPERKTVSPKLQTLLEALRQWDAEQNRARPGHPRNLIKDKSVNSHGR